MARSNGRSHRRPRVVPRRQGEVGAPPGSLAAAAGAGETTVHAFGYSRESWAEQEITASGQITSFLDRWPVTWVNVTGLGNIELVKQIGDLFHLHPLALEDVIHIHQRPKVEPYTDYLFVVVRMPRPNDHLDTEQLSMFLGRNFVVTFQDKPGDCLEPVRERIRHALGRVRTAGADYLAYALVDAVIDHYFPVVERYGDRLEELDTLVLANPEERLIAEVHSIRHDLLVLRRTVAPLRDALAALRSDDSGLLTDDTKLYLRDCYDHVTHLVETVQSYQDMSAWHMEAALSSLNFRSGEVMRVLTLIATIFIPLSFIAGVYGMNFDVERSPLNMPELQWYWGYPFALSLMGATALSLLVYFKRKNWI